ncbi:MAG: 2,3,4,5-tetrahydropyridine-2,6-dicarboxylate N-succinyltransferase [Vulcanimicrobiaceae bacterium]
MRLVLETLESAVHSFIATGADPRSQAGSVIDDVIGALDRGELRVAEPHDDGRWTVNAWIKQAILFYFRRREVTWMGDPEGALPAYFDKLPIKNNYERAKVRCVPPGVARFGAYLAPGVILMPGYVNIGAYVGENTMIDTWATVGSCAQIGKDVHLSGGVGIGGVLEPPQAAPVIIEDGAFIGSRCIVVEGVHVGREAVLGASVVLTASTPIIDVRGATPVRSRGSIPARAVVIPGTVAKKFPAGEFGVPCALIIGERSEATDRKTSLEATLRQYEVAV